MWSLYDIQGYIVDSTLYTAEFRYYPLSPSTKLEVNQPTKKAF